MARTNGDERAAFTSGAQVLKREVIGCSVIGEGGKERLVVGCGATAHDYSYFFFGQAEAGRDGVERGGEKKTRQAGRVK